MSGNDPHLPPEICYEILTKLPVKSILRFRCVCKTWYSLFSCPNFISDHSAQTLTRGTSKRVLVLLHDAGTRLCKASSHDEWFVESHEHDGMAGYIVGSCNGLVCLENGELVAGPDGCTALGQSFQIWNPSIRKLVKQLPLRFSRYRKLWGLSGFGFDSNGRDYKVLRVQPNDYGDLECEIFDMRKGVWRSLSPPKLPGYLAGSSSVSLHGNLHWIGCDRNLNCILLSFDLSIDVFLEMGLPGGVEFKKVDLYSGSRVPKVSLINGLLSVVVLRRQMQGDVHVGCSVWYMKEYGVTESWTKLFNIELPDRLTRLFRFWENGEVLISEKKGKNEEVLALYNPKSKECKALLSKKERIDMCFYNESLVLL